MSLENQWHDPATAIAEGRRLFNKGEYFEAHEVLEDAWRSATGETKQFLKGLIHAAVALHHYGRRNAHGARVKRLSSRDYLAPFQPVWAGINVEALLLEMEEFFSTLEQPFVPVWRPPDDARPQIRTAEP